MLYVRSLQGCRRGSQSAEPRLVQAPDHQQLLLLVELRGGIVCVRALALRRLATFA